MYFNKLTLSGNLSAFSLIYIDPQSGCPVILQLLFSRLLCEDSVLSLNEDLDSESGSTDLVFTSENYCPYPEFLYEFVFVPLLIWLTPLIGLVDLSVYY